MFDGATPEKRTAQEREGERGKRKRRASSCTAGPRGTRLRRICARKPAGKTIERVSRYSNSNRCRHAPAIVAAALHPLAFCSCTQPTRARGPASHSLAAERGTVVLDRLRTDAHNGRGSFGRSSLLRRERMTRAALCPAIASAAFPTSLCEERTSIISDIEAARRDLSDGADDASIQPSVQIRNATSAKLVAPIACLQRCWLSVSGCGESALLPPAPRPFESAVVQGGHSAACHCSPSSAAVAVLLSGSRSQHCSCCLLCCVMCDVVRQSLVSIACLPAVRVPLLLSLSSSESLSLSASASIQL